jgi:hypothetical protein
MNTCIETCRTVSLLLLALICWRDFQPATAAEPQQLKWTVAPAADPSSPELILTGPREIGRVRLWVPEAVMSVPGAAAIYPRGQAWRCDGDVWRQTVDEKSLFAAEQVKKVNDRELEFQQMRLALAGPVRWETEVRAKDDVVSFTIRLTNTGQEPIKQAGAAVCAKFLDGKTWWSDETTWVSIDSLPYPLSELGRKSSHFYKPNPFQVYMLQLKSFDNPFYRQVWGINSNALWRAIMASENRQAHMSVAVSAEKAYFMHCNRGNPCTDVMLAFGDIEPGKTAAATGQIQLSNLSGPKLVSEAKLEDAHRLSVVSAKANQVVKIGALRFANYANGYASYGKPFVHPIYGPGQVTMTRNYPLWHGEDVRGEPTDHPHHKSLWLSHGDVNGEDFWTEKGRIIHERIKSVDEQPRRVVITAENRWTDRHNKTVCTDTTQVCFSEFPGGTRAIDYDVTIHASHGPVTFGDTKEGFMAVRVRPELQLTGDPKQGIHANGHAVNSRGIKDKAVWGERAEWIDYYGQIEGQTMGLAIFDHPDNPRHPTYWHARDYGLVAANPFGVNAFTKGKGNGALTIEAGKDLRFRYRVVLHRGDAQEANVAKLYEEYKK